MHLRIAKPLLSVVIIAWFWCQSLVCLADTDVCLQCENQSRSVSLRQWVSHIWHWQISNCDFNHSKPLATDMYRKIWTSANVPVQSVSPVPVEYQLPNNQTKTNNSNSDSNNRRINTSCLVLTWFWFWFWLDWIESIIRYDTVVSSPKVLAPDSWLLTFWL